MRKVWSLFHLGRWSFRAPAVLLIGLAIALRADPLATWTPVNSGTTNTLRRVAYGNGRWFAVESLPRALTSLDGINWSPLDLGRANGISDIRFGGGQWIAVGGNEISISSDGISWTNHTTPAGIDKLDGLAYGEGTWAAFGRGPGTNGPGSFFSTIALSNDGVSWTNRFHTDAYVSSISYGGGLWVRSGTM